MGRTGGARQLWTMVIIATIVAMLAVIVASFGYVSAQERELRAGRAESLHLRKARQALVETDLAVLNTLVKGERQSRAYAHAIGKLDAHGPDHFPVTVDASNRRVRGFEVVRGLESGWDAIMTRAADRDIAGARALYNERNLGPRMDAMIASIVHRIEELDTLNDRAQSNIDWMVKAVVVLQLLTGLFCIVVFAVAARRSGIESRERALAVTNATRSREEVMRLFEMTDMLQSAQGQGDANRVLRATAMELMPDLGGALYVFNNSRDRLVLSESWNLGDGPVPAEAIALSQCWALKRGKRHFNHPDGDRLSCEHHEGGVNVLEIPMAARGEVLGLLCLRTATADGHARLEGVAELGTALADAMSLALANLALSDKLRSQALRDPLTGLYNRRYMEDTLQRVSQLAQREQQSVAVMMIDLDHFKRLNDQHGHAKGDAVLRDSAAVILNQLRESDVACRYGGEELLIVLPNCGLDDAVGKAERLRIGIAGLSQPGVAVSASIGVAAIPANAGSAQDLVKAADAALYAAKQAGRNRVASAPVMAGWSGPELVAAE